MILNEAQRKQVAGWIADGLKLSEIQNRVAAEFGVSLTYMDVRFLVDDLKVMPKDAEPPKAPALSAAPASPAAPAVPAAGLPAAAPIPGGGVAVTVDQIARPGALVSGKVTFSDGQKADWHLDQTGRLGLAAQTAGYRPSAPDVQQFQVALEAELSKLGF